MAIAQDALAEAQAQANEQLRAQLLAAVAAIYGVGIASDMLTNPAALITFLKRLVPLSLAAQAQMVRSTTLDLARQLPLDRPILLKPTDIIGAKLRGTPIEQVYSRAVYEIEDRLDAGASFEDATAYGLHRVTQNAVTDLQLASNHASREYMTQLQDRVGAKVGSMRVPGETPCALCVLASTQFYDPPTLKPMHPGCGCGTRIVFEDERDAALDEMDRRYLDIGDIIRRDLGDKYVDPGGRKGIEPYKHLFVSHEHGELGSVIGIRRQHFEGPTDVPVQPPLSAN